ncbi:flagellar type III secretion system protein FliR [Hydrogenispora sp. UU3]|uniref:Flagellar biosynthetic protein FliR n=1 Tax=Capillibacterium thermochitinicola TaxID=2699427 RepID=A0A8J6LMR6_9FIRM|nr:flagellar biosynthetic protein FliR [Capillibacterium thermochitinicola]MBA2134044.1 flagellar type III secretion system protein FliR [Capillibacterium thermochitinicola]
MALVTWSEMQISLFMLVFFRNIGLLTGAPLFQSRNLPSMVRVSIALFLSFVFVPLIQPTITLPAHFGVFVFYLLQEFIIGLLMGYILYLTLAGLQLAGQLVDLPMGFGMVNVLNPYTESQMPIIGQLYYIIALWLFILVKGDHTLFNVLAQSYRLLPVGGELLLAKGLPYIIRAFSGLFWLAVQVALPIFGVLFLTDVGLGVLAKLVPQINVFFIGFPLKAFLGLTLLILSLPVLIRWLAGYFSTSGSVWTELLRFLNTIH